jgi:acyl dehydratase
VTIVKGDLAGVVHMANPNQDGREEFLHLEDLHVGQRFVSGTHLIDEGQIKAFAKQFDPQPFHLDAEAAKDTLFEGLVASGWHTAAISMRLLVGSGYPDRGVATIRSETRNQLGEIVQVLIAKLIVPRRTSTAASAEENVSHRVDRSN